MNVGQLIDYLRNYDEADEVEVEVRFSEAGDSYASTFDVVAGPHEIAEKEDECRHPTISAGIGFGTMTEPELDSLIAYIKGIDRRLSYYRGGA